MLLLVVEDVVGPDITDFFPVLVHEKGGFEEGKKYFPDFGFRKLLVVDAFFSIFNLAFERVGEVVVYDLSK